LFGVLLPELLLSLLRLPQLLLCLFGQLGCFLRLARVVAQSQRPVAETLYKLRWVLLKTAADFGGSLIRLKGQERQVVRVLVHRLAASRLRRGLPGLALLLRRPTLNDSLRRLLRAGGRVLLSVLLEQRLLLGRESVGEVIAVC